MSIRIVAREKGHLVDIRVRLASGERVRERVVLDLGKSAAERWAQKRVQHLIVHGKERKEEQTSVAEEIPTLATFHTRYVEGYIVANRQKESTRLAAESVFRCHLLPKLGAKRLDEIGTEDVARLKLSLKGREPKTINNVLSILSRVLKTAVEWDVIPEVRCRIALVKTAPQEMTWYEEADLARLLAAASSVGVDAELIVMLGADAGLRAGEMLALEWSDIRAGILTVSKAEYLGTVASPKSNRSRKVELTARLDAALKRAKHLRGPRVLYAPDGKGMTWKLLKKRMQAVERVAGMATGGHLHILRHTFCSRLAMAGVPAKAIQRLAGHASLMTTEKYMHLSPNAGSEAIRMMERGTTGAVARKAEGAPEGTPAASST